MVDQGTVSAGNFLTVWYLARSLPSVDYGGFVILLSLLLLVNNAQATLIAFPLAVTSSADRGRSATYTSWAFVQTLLLSPASMLTILLPTVAMGNLKTTLYACVSVVFWQLQETTRTALIARAELSKAVIGDAVAYLGRIGILLVLKAIGELSVQNVFVVIAVASSMAIIIQAIQLKVTRICFVGFVSYTREAWKLSSWWFLGRMSGVLTLQIFTWVLAFREGPVGAAKYQALITTLAAVNPLLSSLANIVPPGVSALLSRSGSRVAIGSGIRSSMVLVLPVYAYLVAVLCFPHQILSGFYGATSPYLEFGGTLRVLAVAFACDAIAGVFLAILGGLKQTRPVFASQFSGTLIALIVGGPLTLRWGLTAAAICLTAINGIRATAGVLFVYKIRNSRGANYATRDACTTAALGYTGGES